MNEELKQLYDLLKQSGKVTALPGYEEFEETLTGNESAQKALYDNIQRMGMAPNLPDFKEFQQTLFVGDAPGFVGRGGGESPEAPSTRPNQPASADATPGAKFPASTAFNGDTAPDFTQIGDEPKPEQDLSKQREEPTAAQSTASVQTQFPDKGAFSGPGAPEFVKLNMKAQEFDQQARDNLVTRQDNLRVPDPKATAQAKRYRTERDRYLKSLDTGQSRLGSAGGTIVQAFANTLGKNTVQSLSAAIAKALPEDSMLSLSESALERGDNPLYNFGEKIGNQVKEIFPNNPAYQDEFLTSALPSGFGSMSAFLAGGVLGKGIKAAGAISGGLGALSVSGDEFSRALESGASTEEALQTWMINLPIGSIEAIPILNALKKLDTATGGGVKAILKEGYRGGMEELIQEVGQNVASNTAAHNIYDETRRIFEGVAEGGAAGFILGAFMRGTTTGIGQMKNKVKDETARRILESTESEINQYLEGNAKGEREIVQGDDVDAEQEQDAFSMIEQEYIEEEVDLGEGIDVDPNAPPEVMITQLAAAEREVRQKIRNALSEGVDDAKFRDQLERIIYAKEILTEASPQAKREAARETATRTAQSRPITPEAQQFINKVNEEGGVPGFITNNLRKIARENGIPITETTKPQDVVDALEKKSVKVPVTKPVEQLEQELAQLRQRQKEGSDDPGLAAQIDRWERAIQRQKTGGKQTDAIAPNLGTKPDVVTGKPSTGTPQLSMAFKTNDGQVYTAPREEAPMHSMLFQMHEGIRLDDTDGGGFMTPDGRYLTREEAAEYSNELEGMVTDESRGALFSDDFMDQPAIPEQYEVLGGSAIAEFSSDGLKILDITGNEISPNDTRHTRAAAEFFATQSSPAGQVQRKPGTNDTQHAQRVAEESNNPVEIANTLAQVEDAQGSTDSDLQNNLRERFQEITGQELSPQLAQQIQTRTNRETPTMLSMAGDQDSSSDNTVEEIVGEKLGDRIGESIHPFEVIDAVDAGAYFDPFSEDFESLNLPKSRETIMYMTPDEYISLLDESGQNPDMDDLISVDEIVSEGELIESLPSLTLRTVQSEGESALHVSGHEGAAIAHVLKDEGVKQIPVKVSHPTIRWGESADVVPDFIYGAENTVEEMSRGEGTRVFDTQSVFYPKDISQRNTKPTGRELYAQPDDDIAGVEATGRAAFGPAQSTHGTGGTPLTRGSQRLPSLVGALAREPHTNVDWTKDPVSLRDIINDFIKLLDLTVLVGGTEKNQLGSFDTGTGLIRLKVKESIEALVHEAGHKIEFSSPEIGGLLREYAEVLRPLAYQDAKESVKRQEGFAEFFRIYVLNHAAAKQAAPDFYEAFQTFLESNPDGLPRGIFGKLQDIRMAYAQFLDQPSEVAIDGGIVMAETKGQKVLNFFKENNPWTAFKAMQYRAYESIIGEDYPLLLALVKIKDIHYQNTGENMEISPLLDFYKLNRIALDSYSHGAMDIEHGVQDYNTLKPKGPSLRGALEVALGNDWNQRRRQEFSAYVAARRAINEWERFRNGEITNRPWKWGPAETQRKIDDAEAKKGNESWKKAGDMINEYNRNMFQKLADAGLITQELVDESRKSIPFYVPFFREQGPETGRISEGTIDKKRKTGKETLIKHYDGSDRDVLDPIESMMRMSYQFNNAIKQNDVKVALLKLINQAGPGSAKIGVEIDAKQITSQEVTGKEIKDALKNQTDWAGLDELDAVSLTVGKDNLDNLDFPHISIFRQKDIEEGNRPIIFAMDKGKKRALQLNNTKLGVDMFNVLASQPKNQMDFIVNTLAYPAGWLRTGITTEPSFFIANLVRDQISAWVLTDVGFTPFLSLSEDLKARFNETVVNHQGPVAKGEGVDERTQQEYSRLYRSWSGISTFNVQALDPERAKQEIESLKTKNISLRRLKSIRGLNELLDLSEIGTRLSVFQRTFKKAKAEGMTDKEAAIEAGFEARDLIDFGRHGSRVNFLRRWTPFFNAALQGLDKTYRVTTAEGAVGRAALAKAQESELLTAIVPYLKSINNRPLDKGEQAKLEHSKQAWFQLMQLGAIGAMMAGAYADDPDYDEIPGYLKSTHWIFPDFTAAPDSVRKFVAVPKPFELAIISNTIEAAIQGYKQQDPEWYKTWEKSMWEIIAPPLLPPGVKVPMELRANKRTFDDRPIVYQRMLGLDKSEQYNSYTSSISKKLGDMTDTSPAMIDHAITGITGSWGRVALQMTSKVNPDAPSDGYDDKFVYRRFIRSADRGSRSTKRFYHFAAELEGEVSRRANTFKRIAEEDSPDKAIAYYEKLDDWKKAYVAMKYMPSKEKEEWDAFTYDHPFDHARKATGVLSTMRRELFGEPKDWEDESPNIFKGMDPDKKRDVDDIIDRLATVYYRNSLIASNEPRSKNRVKMDLDKWITILQTKHPEVYQDLTRRFQGANIEVQAQGQYDLFQRHISTPVVIEQMGLILNQELDKIREARRGRQ